MDSLTALLTSEARARVLTALFGEPGRSYYQTQLSRQTGLPLSAVQRELARLAPAGYVRVTEAGGRRLYEADRECSVYLELQAIVLKLRGAAALIRQTVADHKEVRLAWIFGSFAAGDATASSDIDVMVLGRVDARALRRSFGRLEKQLRRTVNEHIVTPTEWSRRAREDSGFLHEVRRGPRLWLVGDERALSALGRKRAP